MPFKNMLLSASLLGLFAVAGTALVAYTHGNTRELIAQNQRTALARNLQTLITPDRYDNDPTLDRIDVQDAALLGSTAAQQVYRARKDGQQVALAFTAVAPDGYSGDINLLIAINHDGSLAGVRVTAHRETPGLGDKIEATRSPWIDGFTGRSLANPQPGQWKVKKDGGVFDQFTGATITPRAVVKAVRHALDYYQQNRDTLFDGAAVTPSPEATHG